MESNVVLNVAVCCFNVCVLYAGGGGLQLGNTMGT